MKFNTYVIFVASSISSCNAFAPRTFATHPITTKNTFTAIAPLNAAKNDEKDIDESVSAKVNKSPKVDDEFEDLVQTNFPGALSNEELVTKVVDILAEKGYKGENTLLATSLCCDELARQLEDDFIGVYGTNFNLGGLAGFPFAGNTGFGAMAAHIPDDGYCLTVYGPHVGLAADGTVGKVERSGIALIDKCCGSAIAANNYVQSITDGSAKINIRIQEFTDFQQGAVQELILPHGKRLKDAEDRMIELPYALFDSQDMLIGEIVQKGCKGVKRGIALLGGVQINTGPATQDYFVPLKFVLINNEGEVVDDMLLRLSND